MLSMYSIGIVESVAMDENGADTPEQVLKFVPKERLRGYAPRVEEAGEAIIAKIQQAADLSNENCHRAMSSIMLAAALSSGKAANEPKPTSVGITSSQTRIAFGVACSMPRRVECAAVAPNALPSSAVAAVGTATAALRNTDAKAPIRAHCAILDCFMSAPKSVCRSLRAVIPLVSTAAALRGVKSRLRMRENPEIQASHRRKLHFRARRCDSATSELLRSTYWSLQTCATRGIDQSSAVIFL
jgi:hypothetical protein